MAMNEVFEKIYRENCSVGQSGKKFGVAQTAILRNEAIILYELCKGIPAQVSSIEIGMANALSTLAICQSHQEKNGGTHIAIDPYQAEVWDNSGILSIQEAGLGDYLTLLEERSFDTLPRFYAEKRKFDVAFIDGNHRFEHTFLDFFYLDRMLNAGGFVMFHDSTMLSVQKVLTYILRFRATEYEVYTPVMGAPRSPLRQLKYFLKHAVLSPLDISSAFTLAANNKHNFMVFRKIRHAEDGELDASWDFYRPF